MVVVSHAKNVGSSRIITPATSRLLVPERILKVVETCSWPEYQRAFFGHGIRTLRTPKKSNESKFDTGSTSRVKKNDTTGTVVPNARHVRLAVSARKFVTCEQSMMYI
jgi:hypothetical protein